MILQARGVMKWHRGSANMVTYSESCEKEGMLGGCEEEK